jgi:hypothetical protein
LKKQGLEQDRGEVGRDIYHANPSFPGGTGSCVTKVYDEGRVCTWPRVWLRQNWKGGGPREGTDPREVLSP